MADKPKLTVPEALNQAIDEFLALKEDVSTVHHVEQRLEMHVTGTDAYLPSYTRQVMDQAHGAPIQAVFTKTDKGTKKTFIYAADDVNDKRARKLRSDETLGPASFAFGVPLRTLQIKLPPSRRLVLPLNRLEIPNQGTVWWVSFAEVEKEARSIDKEAAAAKQAAAKAKKGARKAAKKAAGEQPQP